MSALNRLTVPPSFDYWLARLSGYVRPGRAVLAQSPARATEDGISVVIPSRSGRALLATHLPAILRDLEGLQAEVIVSDNGSDDGTAAWLRVEHPKVVVDVCERPLSFARAVNRGIARSRYSHVCLLNNDMEVAPGFFQALWQPFDEVRDLFCSTAQIHFPPGVRREETGKAVMAQDSLTDFPLRCDEPLPGEDGTPVLYGSGGCSLYDMAKLRALGAIDEAYEPAYVEDLDIGYRAWQRGWPSVYVAGAQVEHRHRATTSRYYTEEQLEEVLELNYLKFLVRAVVDRSLFVELWNHALDRLRLLGDRPAARRALTQAARITRGGGPREQVVFPEREFLALTNGCAASFSGTGEGYALECVEKLDPPSAAGLRAHREIILIRAPRGSDAFRGAARFARHKWGEYGGTTAQR